MPPFHIITPEHHASQMYFQIFHSPPKLFCPAITKPAAVLASTCTRSSCSFPASRQQTLQVRTAGRTVHTRAAFPPNLRLHLYLSEHCIPLITLSVTACHTDGSNSSPVNPLHSQCRVAWTTLPSVRERQREGDPGCRTFIFALRVTSSHPPGSATWFTG